ncbi:hypothetical protein BRC81_00110 [Halobacteriales archaeon QS_1_68_20]|nr:MAG: hypothetical protein BRC81_00110 [Halobacteriales archaeon QS_1_68_20]
MLAQNENDWYTIDLESGQELTVTVQHHNRHVEAGNGIVVEVFDADGNVVGRLDGAATRTGHDVSAGYETASQTVVAETNGTYYVRVTGYDPRGGVGFSGFSEYEVSFTVSQSGDATPTPTRVGSPTPTSEASSTDLPLEVPLLAVVFVIIYGLVLLGGKNGE